MESDTRPGILLDIDGVLHIGDTPIEGAHDALTQLREMGRLRLLTNTTSKSRRNVVEQLRRLGFEVTAEEVRTPAAAAVQHCLDHGYESVRMLVSERLLEDLSPLQPLPEGEGRPHAVILGDLGERFTPEVLNGAFRDIMDGAHLVALQHNRYWRRSDGLALDVGAYAAALEYASAREGVTVGKPSPEFFLSAMADMGCERAVMIGDDVEADVAGAMAAGLAGVLVRTGKYRADALTTRVSPSAVVDSIAEVPELLARMPVA